MRTWMEGLIPSHIWLIGWFIAYVMRSKIENKQYSVDYHDPAKRSIGNAITITLNDGTVLDEVEVEYPVGHKRRRSEGTPLLMGKFERHIGHHFDDGRKKR